MNIKLIKNKFLLLTFLSFLTTNLLAIEKENTYIKKDNITIEISKEIKPTKEMFEFPLDLEGKHISRHVLVVNEEEMKKAIETSLTQSFKQVIIECVYRNHCEMDKDLSFISKMKNSKDLKLNNLIILKKSDGSTFNITSYDLLTKKPELFMLGINQDEVLNVDDIETISEKYKELKSQWIFQEIYDKFDSITYMYIDKFLFTDIKFYKDIISKENVPQYLSTLVGSNYCKVNFTENNDIIMSDKCDITLYNYKDKENLNRLFINTYFVGIIESKEKKENTIIYKLKNIPVSLDKQFINYNKKYSQRNISNYKHILDMWMDKKKYSKFDLNENENEIFREIRTKRFENLINNENIENYYDLVEKMKNLE